MTCSLCDQSSGVIMFTICPKCVRVRGNVIECNHPERLRICNVCIDEMKTSLGAIPRRQRSFA